MHALYARINHIVEENDRTRCKTKEMRYRIGTLGGRDGATLYQVTPTTGDRKKIAVWQWRRMIKEWSVAKNVATTTCVERSVAAMRMINGWLT